MYAQAAVKRNIIPRNGAYRIVNRDVHFCTPPCSSLRSKNYTSLSRITLDTATDPVCGSGHCHIASYWAKELDKENIVAYQASSRGGILYCRISGDKVFLSGKVALYSECDLKI